MNFPMEFVSVHKSSITKSLSGIESKLSSQNGEEAIGLNLLHSTKKNQQVQEKNMNDIDIHHNDSQP